MDQVACDRKWCDLRGLDQAVTSIRALLVHGSGASSQRGLVRMKRLVAHAFTVAQVLFHGQDIGTQEVASEALSTCLLPSKGGDRKEFGACD